ncbi:MAG: TonB-dependent receptor [Desulfobacterales bacterium]|nr:TonB-dependent receptor [Desulfobacterales bacterium]
MKHWIWAVLAIAALTAVPAIADDATDTSNIPATEQLDDVMVTATRSESSLGRIGGASVTVITAKDIEAKQLPTVEEVLKGVPGIDLAANGGLGTSTSVFMRGSDSKNTLVLVDGIMLNDPSGANRGANLANLTTDNIERIEIVRGPMSVLYGSNATAGVINIITKKGKDKPSFYAGAEGGSYATWKAYSGASGKKDRFNYSLSASHTQTDGFSSANDENDGLPDNGNTAEEDGWKNDTFSGKIGFDITPDFQINLISRFQESEVDTDDWGDGYSGDRITFNNATFLYDEEPNGLKEARTETTEAFNKLNVHNFFFDRFFESSFNAQLTDTDRQTYHQDGNQEYDYKGEAMDINWQGVLNFNNKNLLTFGAGYFKEEMESASDNIDNADADTKSAWLQDQFFLFESLDIVAGIRFDDHEKFGDETTYRVAPSYQVQSTGTILKASFATGFRAPSLYELYSSYGNENLKAEKSEGWDVGFEQGILGNKIKFGVTYFEMQFQDRIAYDFNTNAYAHDDGETDTQGVETSLSWAAMDTLDFMLNYTFTDTKDPDGAELTRRPENKVYFNTRYRFLKKAMVNLDLYWVSDREAISSAKDQNGNTVDHLDEYFLVNLAASYDLTKHIRLHGRVDNVFDEFYEEAWSYATAGRSAYAGVKVSF